MHDFFTSSILAAYVTVIYSGVHFVFAIINSPIILDSFILILWKMKMTTVRFLSAARLESLVFTGLFLIFMNILSRPKWAAFLRLSTGTI